ncbi:ultra-long-chain fatty acid omega-hydroxylase-like [Ostrea edulis]|uniref:ultra-long-chain fatty acid omega-hydroxylase-like n=1 Tax=Ostrea edulis TaxID=37623 RepID=UPI0024AFAE3E|nr:ultra-long-chain fatty acid omega-hydroxylase-like [Ostrea edulis]
METSRTYGILSENWTSFLLVSVVTYLVIVVTKYVKDLVSLWSSFRGFPEPKKDRHWLLGHLQIFADNSSRLDKLQEWTVQFPKMYILWIGLSRVRVILNHPDSLKKVLITSDPKPAGFGEPYRHGLPWLGEGLLISSGAKWKRSRRLLTPAFHFDILKPYVKIYKTCADLLLKNLNPHADTGESVEIYNMVSSCTLDIILRCAFSYETDCQNMRGRTHPYVTAVQEIATGWAYRNKSPWLHPDFIFYMTKQGKKFKENCDYVHQVAEDIIDKRRQEIKNMDLSSNRYLDFLDILLTARDEDGGCLTRSEIRSEVDTFLFEGHDTTASAISWILYSLAEHPECQKKCQEEIDKVISETETGELEWKDLGKLEYLTQCIKEGMRLHSPVPAISRINSQPIQVDGSEIPKGSIMLLLLYSLHHNPKVWGEDHMDFKPERFSRENNEKRDAYAFCPFSAGPRNCIGQNFAMSEERVVLATLLKRLSFTLDKTHKTEKVMAAVMRPRDGIKLYITARDNKPASSL